MKVIDDKTNIETIVKCPDCNSIFSYVFKDIQWYSRGTVPALECPCCKTLNHLDMFKKIKENI